MFKWHFGFTNHHLNPYRAFRVREHLLPEAGQVFLSAGKVAGIYLVIGDGQGIYLSC